MDAIPPERWGKDHFTTLLYLETCAVDRDGIIDGRKMRARDSGYPCILRDGEQPLHGDMDCLEDMRAEGLLVGGERNTFRAFHHEGGPNPLKEPNAAFALTDRGWRLAHFLRRGRAEAEGLPEVAPSWR